MRIYGKDYVPPQYIKDAYEYAKKHKWYMEARLITVNDLYAFEPDAKVSLDPFIDIIGRQLQAAEGRARLRQQPDRAHVAHDDVSGQSAVDGFAVRLPVVGRRFAESDRPDSLRWTEASAQTAEQPT